MISSFLPSNFCHPPRNTETFELHNLPPSSPSPSRLFHYPRASFSSPPPRPLERTEWSRNRLPRGGSADTTQEREESRSRTAPGHSTTRPNNILLPASAESWSAPPRPSTLIYKHGRGVGPASSSGSEQTTETTWTWWCRWRHRLSLFRREGDGRAPSRSSTRKVD